MPLHTPTAPLATPHPRRTRAAVIAAAAAILAAATVVIAAEQPATQVRTIAETSQPAAGRYFDIEANKARSQSVR